MARLWSEEVVSPGKVSHKGGGGRGGRGGAWDPVMEDTLDDTIYGDEDEDAEDGARDGGMEAINGAEWEENDDNDDDDEGGRVPIGLALELCILRPITMQYRQACEASIDLLLRDLELVKHLEALRR